jgi:hypothetical protein
MMAMRITSRAPHTLSAGEGCTLLPPSIFGAAIYIFRLMCWLLVIIL